MSNRSLALLSLATLFYAACDSDAALPDASLRRDAAVSDGGGFLDGGSVDAAPLPVDAGSIDAGEPLCDVLVCDPREASASCRSGSCVLWSGAPSCEETAAGLLTTGMTCAGVGECASGLACFEAADGVGVCGQVCCPTDPTGCAVGSRCGGAGVLVDGTVTLWGRCLAVRSCDLLRPAATCEAREACYLLDSTRLTECRIAGVGGAGDACDVQEDCQAGFFCGGIAGARRCVRICSIREDNCPIEEGRCVAQAHTPDGVGLCTIDMTTMRRG